jgi:trehalose 6-phosphate phosphatase
MLQLPHPPLDLLDDAALFLDFDGTLVDLAETPDAIQVPAGLQPLLRRLEERLSGRLAIVSGRSIADLERYLPHGNIALAGSHGLELRLADGERVPLHLPVGLDEVRAQVRDFAQAREGLLVEGKPAGVALHYRRAPGHGSEASTFMEGLGEASGLMVQHGHMVVELRPAGADKGDAVRAFMAQPHYAGARPVFVGDDLTDEHAFHAAAALGGAGILVGPGRDSAALYRLPSVAAVSAWLESCV